MPGYCVAGTVGHKILSGQKKIELDKKNVVCTKCCCIFVSVSFFALKSFCILQLTTLTEIRV